MGQDWKSYEAAAEKGPLSLGFKIILLITVLGIAISVIGYGLGWFGEAAKVAQKEFGPQAALQKYEWFKNAATALDAKQANIEAYRQRQAAMEKSYGDTPRPKWDRTDKEQFNLWEQELAGVIANYNNLAADWNAQISKWNWKSFQGDLPAGASELLSRNFAPYQTK